MFAELDFEGNEDCDHIHSPILEGDSLTAPATMEYRTFGSSNLFD